MARTGELAYIYAKASGILAKSYIGTNVRQLFGQQRLSELYKRIFGETPPQVPERELVAALQRRVVEKTIGLYTKIIDVFRGKEAILIQLLRSFDYLNVKEILYAASAKIERPPPLWDLGRYGEVHAEAYPDLREMLGKTRFAWISRRQDLGDVSAVENALDRQYYGELWEIARGLPSRDRGAVELVKAEALFQNIVWTTRLRVYYEMEEKEIHSRLIELKGIDVVSEALATCAFPLDSRDKWASWKYGFLVNQETGDVGFRLDPRAIEANAAKRLYAMTRRLFHGSPFSLTPSVCFFKLKEFEADILKSVAEGMQMNLPENEILAFLGELR